MPGGVKSPGGTCRRQRQLVQVLSGIRRRQPLRNESVGAMAERSIAKGPDDPRHQRYDAGLLEVHPAIPQRSVSGMNDDIDLEIRAVLATVLDNGLTAHAISFAADFV